MRTRSNPPKESREFENSEQTARQRLDIIREQGANCSKGTAGFENREQTARKRVPNLKTRSKPKNIIENLRTRSRPLSRD